jgi:hypothetical protein
MRALLQALPWSAVIIACATLGLAPFIPLPHVVEKLGMLSRGALARPIDWFDLVLHGTPWLLLAAKAVAAATGGRPRR